MKKTLCTLLMAVCAFTVAAQESTLDLKGEVRFDYQREYLDGDAVKANSALKEST